jgi:hypothetical protein
MNTHHATSEDPLPFKSGIPINAYQILETQGNGLGNLLSQIEAIINGRIAEGDNPCTTLQRRIPGIDWTIHTFEVDPGNMDDKNANKALMLGLRDIITASDYFWSHLTDDGELCVISASITTVQSKLRFYADIERHFVSDYMEADDSDDGDAAMDESWGIPALDEYENEVHSGEELHDESECDELSLFPLMLIEMMETVLADGPIINLLTKEEVRLTSKTD